MGHYFLDTRYFRFRFSILNNNTKKNKKNKKKYGRKSAIYLISCLDGKFVCISITDHTGS